MRSGPVVSPNLYPRRLAVRALELVLAHYNLAGVAVRLNPDDPEQAFPGAAEGQVRLFLDGWDNGKKPVAVVTLRDELALVVIPRICDLVRTNHLADFRAEEVGIIPVPGEPDVDMAVDLSGEIDQMGEAMRTAPPRPASRTWRSGRTPAWRAATRGRRSR